MMNNMTELTGEQYVQICLLAKKQLEQQAKKKKYNKTILLWFSTPAFGGFVNWLQGH